MQLWFAAEAVLEGVPTDEGWPTTEELSKLLRSRPFAAVTTHDVESDCRQLLATGLFGSVRPILKPPSKFAPAQCDVPPLCIHSLCSCEAAQCCRRARWVAVSGGWHTIGVPPATAGCA